MSSILDCCGLHFCAAYFPENNLRRISTTYLRGYWKGSENVRVVTIASKDWKAKWFEILGRKKTKGPKQDSQSNLRGYHTLQGDNSLKSVERFDHMMFVCRCQASRWSKQLKLLLFLLRQIFVCKDNLSDFNL